MYTQINATYGEDGVVGNADSAMVGRYLKSNTNKWTSQEHSHTYGDDGVVGNADDVSAMVGAAVSNSTVSWFEGSFAFPVASVTTLQCCSV
jgi:hypothetical protein